MIRVENLNAMLDLYFYNDGTAANVILYDDSHVQIDVQTALFTAASGGETHTTSVSFSVLAGTTVSSIEIEDETNFLVEVEDLENKTYTSNGTYTVTLISKTLIGA